MFRAIVFLAIALLLVVVGGRAFLIGQVRPHAENLREISANLNALHTGLVDQETALRGYTATGSAQFLQPFTAAIPVIGTTSTLLTREVTRGDLTADFVGVQVAEQRWSQDWAAVAVTPDKAEEIGSAVGDKTYDAARLSTYFLAGKALFDAYRVTYDRFRADIDRALAAADTSESTWLLWTGVVEALLIAAMVVVVFGASRRLRRLVAAPVASLARTVAELRSGNLDARVPLTDGPTELVSLASDVDEMAVALQAQSELVELRQQEVLRHAGRLSLVLGVAREVAGSLSLRYVMESVTGAACAIGSSRARVWLVEPDERTVTLSYDSGRDRKTVFVARQTELGVGCVGRAVKYGRPIGPEPADEVGVFVVSVPMVIGGRVVGVLECVGPRYREDSADILEILEALAGQAAGSVESARLHEYTRELSITDSLTGLPNRRAFDEDIDTEVRRAARYTRPLSVIYLDLDNFKAVNDRHGHDFGDTVLQQTAAALRAAIRSTDRCYRLGGEELIVIAPETTASEAAEVAERLRVAVERSAGPDSPKVTASFGVAELPSHAMDSASLVRFADTAVYAAKAQGRNRVVIADLADVPFPRMPRVTGAAAQDNLPAPEPSPLVQRP